MQEQGVYPAIYGDCMAGLETIFLELSGKISDGIILSNGYDQSLYLLVFLHQKIFPVFLQETINMTLEGISLHSVQFLLVICEYYLW